ncbi:MAG: DUF448 domain-containing protein [Arcobacter sp.]|nr:DUF448 domain-containing protein [Arcobacter sp.]
MIILKKPIRTCINCRCKNEQNVMLRLRCEDKKLVLFKNNGRSFYICNDCISIIKESQNNQKDYKKLEKTLFRECKNKDDYIGQLKEILTHVR